MYYLKQDLSLESARSISILIVETAEVQTKHGWCTLGCINGFAPRHPQSGWYMGIHSEHWHWLYTSCFSLVFWTFWISTVAWCHSMGHHLKIPKSSLKKKIRERAGGGRELGYCFLTLKLKRTHVGKYVTVKRVEQEVDKARRRKSAKQRVTLLKSFW